MHILNMYNCFFCSDTSSLQNKPLCMDTNNLPINIYYCVHPAKFCIKASKLMFAVDTLLRLTSRWCLAITGASTRAR